MVKKGNCGDDWRGKQMRTEKKGIVSIGKKKSKGSRKRKTCERGNKDRREKRGRRGEKGETEGQQWGQSGVNLG